MVGSTTASGSTTVLSTVNPPGNSTRVLVTVNPTDVSAFVIVTHAGVITAGCQAWLPSGSVGGVSTRVHTEPNGTWSVTIAGSAPAVVDHVFGVGVTSVPSRSQENVPE